MMSQQLAENRASRRVELRVRRPARLPQRRRARPRPAERRLPVGSAESCHAQGHERARLPRRTGARALTDDLTVFHRVGRGLVDRLDLEPCGLELSTRRRLVEPDDIRHRDRRRAGRDRELHRVTALQRASGRGDCSTTVPAGFCESTLVTVERSPSSRRRARASETSSPVRRGTSIVVGAAVGRGFATCRLTTLPSSTSVPASGDWRMTVPTAFEEATRAISTRSPSSCSRRRAVDTGSPTTSGTVAPAGPLETVSVTSPPAETFAPAAGC